MPTPSESQFQPPYMSWATFEGILDQLKSAGLPDVIDRSVLSGKSGGDQSQFLRACRNFGLIDEETDQPTELMRTLVHAEDRSDALGGILRKAYGPVVSLGTGATQAMLEEKFRDYGIDGDTVRKAIAFYLNAAKQTDIELSPRFKSTRPGQGGRRTRRTVKKPNGASNGAAEQAPPPAPAPHAGLHPAITTLVKELPAFSESGEKPAFSTAQRKAWFAYAEATFNLIYALPEGDPGGAAD